MQRTRKIGLDVQSECDSESDFPSQITVWINEVKKKIDDL